ncbi:FLYWCH-type zinc finger-containing protein 1 [Frankliniella fusca]|uniref:FLYWCH-type zinc finger-containing protein 1 n=1 Tax=Frankliniella fusca TaxID=407009 RepID=A0AAE1HM40_9NEOP|nr:FLYWCH-type zinc finger-containing protein 1 [Frankliniella fusca]
MPPAVVTQSRAVPHAPTPTMAPLFSTSKRGKNQLANNGFIYNKHSRKKERTYWVCHKKPLCIARATTTDDPLPVIREGTYSDAPDADTIAARQVMEEIKEAGVSQRDRAPVQIIDHRLNNINEGALAKLPERGAMERTVNRVRQSRLPSNPKTLADLGALPPEFKITNSGESFIIYDSYEDRDHSDSDSSDDEPVTPPRVLVFSSKENLQKLGRSRTWFSDGTFTVSPSLFTQLFTIHGLYGDVALPFVYALLPDKTEVSYT